MELPSNPNDPIIFAGNHWELIWLYPLLKKTNWPVLFYSENVSNMCKDFGFREISIEEAESHKKFITVLQHFNSHRQRIDHWMATGGQVYVLQHAWDPVLALIDEFWSAHMNSFTKFLVGCTQDYNWLSAKYGDRIKLTGSPRLAMVNDIKEMDLSDIYEKVGSKDFFVATPPIGSGFHSDATLDLYHRDLPNMTQSKIVYKMHPSVDPHPLMEQYPNHFFWQDSHNDPYDTYKLIMASRGLVTPSSFLGIEATLMNKPVILLGDLTEEEYQRQDWQHQRERLPREMSSSLANPTFTEKQREVKSWYKYESDALDNVIKEVLT